MLQFITLPFQLFHPHLTKQEYRNPRLVIKSVFADSDMPEERALLGRLIFCTFSVQRRPSEEQMIFIPRLRNTLLRLLDAATLLAKEKGPDVRTWPNEFELLDQEWFFKPRYGRQIPACYFPRHLDIEEMINPYCVFDIAGKYDTIKGWESLLGMMLTAANSRGCIGEATGHKRLYRDCHFLLKLLEAAYLVYVREIQEVSDIGTMRS
jgi:hypothetical protein